MTRLRQTTAWTDESRMSNDESMTKREMARGEQGATVSSPAESNDNGNDRMSSANGAISPEPGATPKLSELKVRFSQRYDSN